MYMTVLPRNIPSVYNNPDRNIPCICDILIKTIRVQNNPNYNHSRMMDRIMHEPHLAWTTRSQVGLNLVLT
jgi:hypothetical protein